MGWWWKIFTLIDSSICSSPQSSIPGSNPPTRWKKCRSMAKTSPPNTGLLSQTISNHEPFLPHEGTIQELQAGQMSPLTHRNAPTAESRCSSRRNVYDSHWKSSRQLNTPLTGHWVALYWKVRQSITSTMGETTLVLKRGGTLVHGLC